MSDHIESPAMHPYFLIEVYSKGEIEIYGNEKHSVLIRWHLAIKQNQSLHANAGKAFLIQ